MKQVKLEIKDEVNCKLIGLELTDRKTLMRMFEYEMPGARYLPSVRLGRWNGKISYFSLGGSTYINLLSEILPLLDQAGYDIELVDNRDYNTSFTFDPVTETTFAHKNWPKGHPKEGEPVVLRDYQIEIINNFLSNPQALQEIATGAGKTLMTAALSHSIEQYGRSIVIVPNKSLVTQTESDYINLGLDVGVYFGDRKEYNKTHTICTWQSLNNMLKKTKNGEAEVDINDFIEGVVCVMVDECFSGTSRVLTTNGYVPIKNIKPGDKVINYSEETKKFKVDTVVKQHTNLTNSSMEKMYKMEFDNGSIIEVTGNHKFLTNHGWVRADELTENHEILTPSISTDNESKGIKMNPRTMDKMIRINKRLEEFNQNTRLIELSTTRTLLNTGKEIFSPNLDKFIKRIMNTKIIDWVKNTDNLLSGIIHESEIKSISFSVGGRAAQAKHGDKIRKNLNYSLNSFIKGHAPWNAGTKGQNIGKGKPCSLETKNKIREKLLGENNCRYGYKYSAEEREQKSIALKQAILTGRFTPKLNNRNTYWEASLDGTLYRSSWEALYKYINPNANYEKLRIPYQHADESKIYIVDFIDHVDKQVVEVKPKELCVGEKFACKMNALTEWANTNAYTVLIVDKDWLLTRMPILDYSRFDKNTEKKIKALYETHKKN
jgi:hypothetical protein